MGTQTSKDQMWFDESGTGIPYKRTTILERTKEKHSATLVKDALAVNKRLESLKQTIKNLCEEVYRQASDENKVKLDSKGNFTWFNFDRSIKIETSINERIEFDDLTIASAKQLLDEFIIDDIDSKSGFGREMVIDAFSTTRGKLDAKKVLGLLKWRNKVKSDKYSSAMDLIEKSVRRPDSKTYHRVFVRDEDGKYNAIELNFSNI